MELPVDHPAYANCCKATPCNQSELIEPLGLKPCPFCGETPPVDDPYTFYANQGEKWGHVLCGCGACGPEVRTEYKPLPHWKDAAIAEWNNRKP